MVRASDVIPRGGSSATVTASKRRVALTNLDKVFWPQTGATKRDLLRYYSTLAPLLLPHVRGKAMVLKRYPHGATGDFFFMKRAPVPRPDWIETCSIEHGSGSVIDFVMVNDLASLLWTVNLGCIDLNPWYAPCDDVNTPEYLHFDLDPVDAPFETVREAALIVRDALRALGMPVYAKTSGASGIHVYVPIVREPLQKEVWTFAKFFAGRIATAHPDILTAEYRIAKRPAGTVLVDYNQNAWGKTLASIYSVRPTPTATVSTPLAWDEVEAGCTPQDFTIESVPARVAQKGDLWKALTKPHGRFNLQKLLERI